MRKRFDLFPSLRFTLGVNDGSQIGVNARLLLRGNLIEDVAYLMQPAA